MGAAELWIEDDVGNYDPGTGKFLQKDPRPGALNLPVTVVNRYTLEGLERGPVQTREGLQGKKRAFGLLGFFTGGLAGLGASNIPSANPGSVPLPKAGPLVPTAWPQCPLPQPEVNPQPLM